MEFADNGDLLQKIDKVKINQEIFEEK